MKRTAALEFFAGLLQLYPAANNLCDVRSRNEVIYKMLWDKSAHLLVPIHPQLRCPGSGPALLFLLVQTP